MTWWTAIMTSPLFLCQMLTRETCKSREPERSLKKRPLITEDAVYVNDRPLWCSWFHLSVWDSGKCPSSAYSTSTANTRCEANVRLMLGQPRRQWTSRRVAHPVTWWYQPITAVIQLLFKLGGRIYHTFPFYFPFEITRNVRFIEYLCYHGYVHYNILLFQYGDRP